MPHPEVTRALYAIERATGRQYQELHKALENAGADVAQVLYRLARDIEDKAAQGARHALNRGRFGF